MNKSKHIIDRLGRLRSRSFWGGRTNPGKCSASTTGRHGEYLLASFWIDECFWLSNAAPHQGHCPCLSPSSTASHPGCVLGASCGRWPRPWHDAPGGPARPVPPHRRRQDSADWHQIPARPLVWCQQPRMECLGMIRHDALGGNVLTIHLLHLLKQVGKFQ